MRRNEDIAAIKKEQAILRKTLEIDAKIALLLRKIAFSPYDYVMLKSDVDNYEKMNIDYYDYYDLKGKTKLAKHKRSVKYYQVTSSSLKSPKEEKVLANMEKTISNMEIAAAKKQAALSAFRNRLRETRGEVTRSRKR